MRASRSWFVSLTLILPALGCAGGWRNGVPAQWASDASTSAAGSATAAPAATSSATAASGGTHATADGAQFVFVGNAGSVSVAGEFNTWNTTADAMSKQPDGRWTLDKKLAPGRYLYKFVLDGGTWKEDPGARETADDGYGGKNSVLVVGGAAAPAAGAAVTAPAAPTKPVTGKPRAPQVTADGVLFTFAGAARSVALCGTFNQWAPAVDPMQQQSDGTWTITKRLPAGTHTYKFLVDGSQWKADEANPEGQDDGFGGRNSVVEVK